MPLLPLLVIFLYIIPFDFGRAHLYPLMISHLQTQKQYVLTLISQYRHNPLVGSLLQLLTHLNTNQDAFLTTYREIPENDPGAKKEYFKVLVEVFNFCRGEGKEQ
jgi:uncharacterized protein YbgA (DUF1722 family)